MKHHVATLISLAIFAASSTALCDDIAVRRGQFTDRVERGAPVAPASELGGARRIMYWIEASNAGAPAELTLVWRVGGREVNRQTLSVGRSPRWRTWAVLARRGAGAVEVRVLDASGEVIHQDRLGGS